MEKWVVIVKSGLASILALGKSIPSYSLSQMQLASTLTNLMQLSDEEAWFLEKIYKNSAISKRYSVLPDIMHPQTRFRSHSQSLRTIGMTERNETYKKEAPLLAAKAARNALQEWNRPAKEITHVLSVSCTGAITPGIEYLLAHQLALDPHTSLLGINFLGCYGALKAIKVATKIAKENPRNRILLVSTELCTLHFKPHGDMESIVIQSLFADGSAAAVVGSQPKEGEKALFDIIQEGSVLIDNTLGDMTWDAGDEGFIMGLSQKLPSIIADNIQPFVQRLIGASLSTKDFAWAIHPGGKAILEVMEKTFQLEKSQTQASWKVLQEFGNMSSATFLYVLDEMRKQEIFTNKPIIGLGFGPGIAVEGILLHGGS